MRERQGVREGEMGGGEEGVEPQLLSHTCREATASPPPPQRSDIHSGGRLREGGGRVEAPTQTPAAALHFKGLKYKNNL